MATSTETGNDQNISSLVSGIVSDAGELLSQQADLLRVEVKKDLDRTQQAFIALGIGLGTCSVGGVLLTFMIVYLLKWLFPNMALWVCYLIPGALLMGVGVALFMSGKKQFESFNPLPDETAEAAAENVKWIMKPK